MFPDPEPTGPEKRAAFLKRSIKWSQVVVAPFEEMSCDQFKSRGALWSTICANTRNNFSGKKAEVRKAADDLIADIESWDHNAQCQFVLYNHVGGYGVAVIHVDGFERPGSCTVRYILSDGSQGGIGASLIEEAVNLSERHGKEGKLCLIAKSDWLEAHYGKYGFQTVQPASTFSGAVMTLSPKAPIWFRDKRRWKYCGI